MYHIAYRVHVLGMMVVGQKIPSKTRPTSAIYVFVMIILFPNLMDHSHKNRNRTRTTKINPFDVMASVRVPKCLHLLAGKAPFTEDRWQRSCVFCFWLLMAVRKNHNFFSHLSFTKSYHFLY